MSNLRTITTGLLRGLKMKVYEIASILIVVGLLAAAGIGAFVITKKHDGPIEEFVEDKIEDTIEEALNLPDNALDGKIDLSITSPEKD